MTLYKNLSQQWFIDRISKRIYRKKLKCSCRSCQKEYVDIHDRQHAIYLYDVAREMGIRYYDKPGE